MLRILACCACIASALRSADGGTMPIEMDISAELPARILAIPYSTFGGTYYAINDDEYRIGEVREGPIIISPDNINNIVKTIVYNVNDAGTRYLRIGIIYDVGGGTERRVEEWIREAHEDAYKEVVREPVDLDLQCPLNTPNVHAIERADGTNYIIDETREHSSFIGMVRYGHVILESTLEGVVYKIVTRMRKNEESSGGWKVVVTVILKDGRMLSESREW